MPDESVTLLREPSTGGAAQTHKEELRTSHIALKYHWKWLISRNGFDRRMLHFLPGRSERTMVPSGRSDAMRTARRCFTSLLWDRCGGVNLSVTHRKLQTQMQVRWKSRATQQQPTTTQNWIQFPASCGRDGGGTELAGAEKSPHRSGLGLD